MARKIGRYEILGPLASGGMAEIDLARLVGPSGFERVVVIKRMRTDLEGEDPTSLFLQEARIAAKVRHPNVVQVEDLGTHEGAPYLVMEYLEGESVANLTRRLLTRDEKLPFGLAGYVLAEACAGLHAAHELRDADGRFVGLVHRDVSPQNLFVMYAGTVKVVDFGIAKVERGTQTSPGEVRGKFAYMAPEQLKGEPFDRRTDVFALGVVMHELLTGHRLFKRWNERATMRAITTDPIVPPSRVEPSVPAALDAICMRALSRPPGERYATAAEMRKDLLMAVRDLVSEDPRAELAELMARCFSDRIADKRAVLRNVREGSVVDRVPAGDVDVTIEIPVLNDSAATWVTSAPTSSPAPVRSGEPPSAAALARSDARRGYRAWWIGGTSAAAAVVLGVLGLRFTTQTSPAAPAAQRPENATSSEAASTAASASTEPTPAPPVSEVTPREAPPSPSVPSAHAEGRATPGRRVRPPATTATSRPEAPRPAEPPPVPSPAPSPTPPPASSGRGYRRFQ